MDEFDNKCITLIAVKEGINTGTSTGKMTAKIFALVADIEHDLILERTAAGREAMRRSGKKAKPRGKTWNEKDAMKALNMRQHGNTW